jgi:metacaspase-1
MPDAHASVVGAMTHSFIRTLECQPRGVTYGHLLSSMRAIMKNRGGGCDMQGAIGAPIRTVANFSGVQVSMSRVSLSLSTTTSSASCCAPLTN